MKRLSMISPQPLWNYFEEICRIPRPSKKEEKIRQYLLDFAHAKNLMVKTDNAGNVLISKSAGPGREGAPVVVLQTHMDMVCEKNADVDFDFDADPIIPVADGDWVSATGTTLGADCGIGIAAQLAVLASDTILHGPLECLFTVDEETGLTGAFELERGFISGKILLNLDSEDEGEIFIGCAGGIDTVATFRVHPEEIPAGYSSWKIGAGGLQGGHSGDDIHKGRGNANKILTRFLLQVSREMDAKISAFNGGNLRNAIPREAWCIFLIPENGAELLKTVFDKFAADIRFEFINTEPGLDIRLTETEKPEIVMEAGIQMRMVNALMACPHGVLEMSSRMPGMVETSTNLASVKFRDGNKIAITTSQRSEIESRKKMAASMVEAVFSLAGAEVEHSDGYPGWTPDPESAILKLTVASYKKLFGVDPIVRSIHAGLECGLFKEKYPDLDMVSFGPTIRGAHSPSEKVSIPATQKFWLHLVDLLEEI